jgi:hypothetical protein
MAKQKKYHFIYKTTCSITNKFYVGMHSTDNLNDGYLGSGKILGYSRKKYGDENHMLEILEHCHSREELKVREKEIVNEQLLSDPLNINLKYGGDGGRTHVPLPQFYSAGGKATWKQNLSLTWTPEAKRKNVETRKKNGSLFTIGMLGKKHNPETKVKMSLSGSGEKNSQFGSCWITDGAKPIKIKKEQLDEYLAKGYSRGRIKNTPVV